MILRTEDLKDTCQIILTAVDSSSFSTITETLELKTDKNILHLNVTNKEYYVQVKLDLQEVVEFHATVSANLFLKLISQTTAETVELKVKENVLEVRGNGNYKLPLIYDNNKLLELPEITISNKTNEFDITSDILLSIYKYNSKELTKNVIASPVQKMYYIDEKGCITFSSGACVNNFILNQPIKLLLNNRLVKLFKLFKEPNVHFILGKDIVNEDIIQTKVQFEDSSIIITSILPDDDNLITSVPVEAIRGRANTIYQYSVSLNRASLIEAIDRLLLFSSEMKSDLMKPSGAFNFEKEKVTIYDSSNENFESLYYYAEGIKDEYKVILDLSELKTALENRADTYINISFGNHEAITISGNNITNVIPECHEVSNE